MRLVCGGKNIGVLSVLLGVLFTAFMVYMVLYSHCWVIWILGSTYFGVWLGGLENALNNDI